MRLVYLLLGLLPVFDAGARAPSHAASPGATASKPRPSPDSDGDSAPNEEPPAGYHLIFAEEFDGSTLDRTHWCTRYIYSGGARLERPDPECNLRGEGTLDFLNDEQQRYRDTSASGVELHRVVDGTLSLIAVRGAKRGRYESAMIRSKRLFLPTAESSLYLVGRVRLPSIRGTWPALWLNSDRDAKGRLSWPPEIDVFEAPLNGSDDRVNMLHLGAVARGQPKTILHAHRDFDRRWRNYVAPRSLRDVWLRTAIEWKDTSVCYFVDGIKLMCEAYRWVRRDGATLAPPAHLIVNLAIGGEWAGRNGVDDSRFPAKFSIDYLRVYERRPAGLLEGFAPASSE
jgi:beta-glucanase (GH16 family)